MKFNKTVLDNGLRVVTETHEWSKSVHIGLFIESGTKHELEGQMGMAHLTEHMVFKGTKTQSALDIVANIEKLGGEINAHTSRDYTCYTIQCLPKGLDSGLNTLFDLSFQASFPANEFEREVDVVKQEIDMSKDLMEDYIFDLYFERAFPGHPISRNILGTPESLGKITRDDLLNYYQSSYKNRRMILAVTGNIKHEEVLESLQKQNLDQLTKPKKMDDLYPEKQLNDLVHQKFYEWIPKVMEQTHMLVGLPSVAFTNKRRFESYILSSALGGGMTSKLYQIIREDKGWAYSIYTYLQSFVEGGSLAIYLGTNSENVLPSAKIINEQIKNIKENSLNKEDLQLYKTQVEASILMGADDLESRMNSIGVNEMVFGEYRSVEEVLGDIQKVSQDSLQDFAGEYLDSSLASLLAVGPANEEQVQSVKNFKFDF